MPKQSTTPYLRACHRCGSIVGRDGDPDTVFTGDAWLPGLWPRCGACLRQDTGSDDGIRRCPSCHRRKSRAEFGFDRGPLSGMSTYCKRCDKEQEGRERALRFGGRAESVSYDAIAQRDNGICYLCGRGVSLEDESFDHVIALGNGGSHSGANIRLTHVVCNIKKGRKTYDEQAGG